MALVAVLSGARRVAAVVPLPRSLLAGWLIAIGVVMHLVLAVSAGLSPDEAHYALYGAFPAWSYFDHPPLVGWLQAPFVAAGGADLLMRVVPMATWLIAVCLMISLCRRLPLGADGRPPSPARSDRWVALMMLTSPLLNLLGVALVPDTLLMALVPAAMSATWGLRDGQRAADTRRWLTLALVSALCVLAKYTGLFVLLGALLSLWRFHGSALPRMRGAWLCAAIAVLSASPVIAWNLQNHWASVAYQAAHAVGYRSWDLVSVLRAVLLQLALYGLLLPMAVAKVLRKGAGEGGAFDDARAMGIAFAAPLLIVFTVLAGRGASLPHWTACAWTALVPLAVAGAMRMPARWIAANVAWQAALLLAIPGLVLTGGPGTETAAAATTGAGVRLAGTHPNPVADVFGWEAAALHGAGLAGQRNARGLVVMNWSLASRLAWYARPMPVFVVPEHNDQFRLWFGALQPGDSAVVVDWSVMPLQVPTGPDGFATCRLLEQLPTIVQGRQLAHFNYVYCQGWRAAVGTH